MSVEKYIGAGELDVDELNDDADGFVDDTRGHCTAIKALIHWLLGGCDDD